MPRFGVPLVALGLVAGIACVSVPPQKVPPVPPKSSEAVVAHRHRATLSWNPPAKDAAAVQGYNIYRSPASVIRGMVRCAEHWAKIGSTAPPNTQFTDENVTAGRAYCYAVTSISPRGESGKSIVATAVIPTP